jgi:hypothetical protein
MRMRLPHQALDRPVVALSPQVHARFLLRCMPGFFFAPFAAFVLKCRLSEDRRERKGSTLSTDGSLTLDPPAHLLRVSVV